MVHSRRHHRDAAWPRAAAAPDHKEKEVEKRIGIERKVAKRSSADEWSTLAENNTSVRAMDRDKQEGNKPTTVHVSRKTRMKKKARTQHQLPGDESHHQLTHARTKQI